MINKYPDQALIPKLSLPLILRHSAQVIEIIASLHDG